MNRSKTEWSKWLPAAIVAIALMVVYTALSNYFEIKAALGRFLSVISPLLLGILFSYFLYIPALKLEGAFRKPGAGFVSRKARGLGVLLVFLVLIMILVLLFLFVVPVLISSAADLAANVPLYLDSVTDFLDESAGDFTLFGFDIVGVLLEYVDGFTERLFDRIVVDQLARGAVGFARGIFNVVLGLVLSIYILLERGRIAIFIKRLSGAVFKDERRRVRVNLRLRQCNGVLLTFIASKGLDSVINVVVVTCMLLLLKVPYAILLGLIAGLLNFIPVLGSLVAVSSIILISLITGGLGKAIQVFIPLIIFQQMDANFIDPSILRSSLKISPILVITMVIAGMAYFGVAGAFLAVPFTVIVKQFVMGFIDESEVTEGKARRPKTLG